MAATPRIFTGPQAVAPRDLIPIRTSNRGRPLGSKNKLKRQRTYKPLPPSPTTQPTTSITLQQLWKPQRTNTPVTEPAPIAAAPAEPATPTIETIETVELLDSPLSSLDPWDLDYPMSE